MRDMKVDSIIVAQQDEFPQLAWASDFLIHRTSLADDIDRDVIMGGKVSYTVVDDMVILETSQSIETRHLATGNLAWQLNTGGMILGADESNVYVAVTPQLIAA